MRGGAGGGSVEGEAAGVAEIQAARIDALLGRPRVVLLPLIRAGFESGGFGLVELALAAQPVIEPGLENVVAVIRAGVGAEVDRAEAGAGAVPAAVIPRAGNEVIEMPSIVRLERGVDTLRAVEIFLVPPAGDVHDGNLDGVQIGREGQALPEGIVVGVAREIFPGGELTVEILFVGVRRSEEHTSEL